MLLIYHIYLDLFISVLVFIVRYRMTRRLFALAVDEPWPEGACGGATGTKSRLRKLCAAAPLPGQSSTSISVGGEPWFGRGALRNAREAEFRTYGSSVCFSYTIFIYISFFFLCLCFVSFTNN